MTDTTFDPRTLVEAYRTAVAPALKTLDRIGRYQFAVAADYFDWTLAQAKAGLEAQSPAELASKQTNLNTALSDKLRTRGQEFFALATEAQNNLSQAFKDATAEVAEISKSKRAA